MPGKLDEALEVAKDPQRRLGVDIGGNNVEEAGQFIPKAGTCSIKPTKHT